MNAALYRTSGLMLTHETPEQRQAAVRAEAHKAVVRARAQMAKQHRHQDQRREKRRAAYRAKRQTARAERAAAKEAERAAAKAERLAARQEGRRQREARDRARKVARYDEDLWATIERVTPRTMTSPPKLAALIEATRYVARNRIPGALVECGVWRGGSMQAIALALLQVGDADRELHLFDTFAGMPPPSAEDTRTTEVGAVPAEKLLAESDRDSWVWAVADLADVREAMAETAYPPDRIHFHPGLVEDTTPGEAPDVIALLRLDTDWYASTKHELEHLYDRLSPGGVLILDDYGDWDGARKAVDEWLQRTGEPLFLAPMGSGCIAIKPLDRQA